MSIFSAVGSLFGGDGGTGAAVSADQAGSAAAVAAEQQMFQQSQADLNPYMTQGDTAETQMMNPSFQQGFTSADFQEDPGYQFQLQQGQQAIQRSAAAQGGLLNGGVLKDLDTYSQGMANTDYEQAFNNFNTTQNQQFGRLSTVASLGENAAAAGSGAAMSAGSTIAGIDTSAANAEASASIAQGNQNSALAGQLIGGGAMLGAASMAPTPTTNNYFSDLRLKKDIEPVSKADLSEMRVALKAYKFKYKDETMGKGEFIGVMAQDLEQSKLGKTLVFEDKKGRKQIDIGRVMMLFLATLAEA